MQHHKPGYVLFLLFSILSVCTILISLYFSKAISYRDLTHLITTKDKAYQLAIGSCALGQSILYVPEQKKSDKDKDQPAQNYDQQLLQQSLIYTFNTIQHKLKSEVEGIDANIKINMSCENGKLNINSLYDFAQKKFVNQGAKGDTKEFCKWLFSQISKATEQPSLFEPFEKYLQERSIEFNDVTELLQIKEFEKTFSQALFFNPQAKNKKQLYLTDLFTIKTQQEGINPWFLTHSWRLLLGLPESINLSTDELKQLIPNFKKQANWEKDWEDSLKILYKQEYSALPKEMKSMLTTDFEANIFSLLIETIIGETTSTIFTILKANTKNKPTIFDIIKVYQL